VTAEHERELREAWERGHEREHELAQRALQIAADLAAQNKADSNEWRAAMTDRERTFATKAESEAVSMRLELLERSDVARTTREQERERAQVRTMALIGLGATVVSVALSVLIRLGLG
jgi:hypothetical protein